jgi:hypothetical protein
MADVAAKQATGIQPTGPDAPTLAHVKAQAKREKHKIVQTWWESAAPQSYKELGLGPYPDTQGLSRNEMSQLVAYRTKHGRFASYFERFNIDAEGPVYPYGVTVEPGHLTRCLRTRRVVYKAREKYKIDSEDETHRFFLGKGHKGVGAREWFPKLFK